MINFGMLINADRIWRAVNSWTCYWILQELYIFSENKLLYLCSMFTTRLAIGIYCIEPSSGIVRDRYISAFCITWTMYSISLSLETKSALFDTVFNECRRWRKWRSSVSVNFPTTLQQAVYSVTSFLFSQCSWYQPVIINMHYSTVLFSLSHPIPYRFRQRFMVQIVKIFVSDLFTMIYLFD